MPLMVARLPAPSRAARFAPEEDVFGNRQVGAEHQLLMNEREAIGKATPGSRSTTGAPSTRISPLSGGMSPFMIDSSVDLPAPFSPTRAWTSPVRTSNVTSERATTPGNDLRIDLTSRSGARGPWRQLE